MSIKSRREFFRSKTFFYVIVVHYFLALFIHLIQDTIYSFFQTVSIGLLFSSYCVIRYGVYGREEDLYQTQAQQIREKEDEYFLREVVKEKIKEKTRVKRYKFIQK